MDDPESEIQEEVADEELHQEVKNQVSELKQELNNYGSQSSSPPLKQKPGSLTRKPRRTPSAENAPPPKPLEPEAANTPTHSPQRPPSEADKSKIPSAWGPGTWNKFARELPESRPKVKLTKASKKDLVRVQQWEEEKRMIRERDRIAQLAKREAEERAKKAAEEAKRAERRATLERRIMAQKEKIRRAIQERQRREEEYQELLERTREKGLLHDRLQAEGEKFVEGVELEKKMQYKDTVGKVRKLTAKEIQEREELHPALKQMQRRQMAENYEREARKEVPFVTTKIGGPTHSRNNSGFGSAFPSGMTQQGSSSLNRTPSLESNGQPKAPKPKPRKRKPLMVERASSPILLEGVEILVHGRPYVPVSSSLAGGDAAHGHDERVSDAHSPAEHVSPRSAAAESSRHEADPAEAGVDEEPGAEQSQSGAADAVEAPPEESADVEAEDVGAAGGESATGEAAQEEEAAEADQIDDEGAEATGGEVEEEPEEEVEAAAEGDVEAGEEIAEASPGPGAADDVQED